MEEYGWEESLRRLSKRGEPADFKAFLREYATHPAIDPQMWAAMYPMVIADHVGKTLLAAALQLPPAEAERGATAGFLGGRHLRPGAGRLVPCRHRTSGNARDLCGHPPRIEHLRLRRAGATGGCPRRIHRRAGGARCAPVCRNCTRCHGDHGEGERGVGPALNTAEYLEEANDQSIFDTITDGRPNTAMPAWGQDNGGPFTPEDIKDLVAYIRAWEPTAPPAAEVELEADPALGAALYSVTCFACHGLNGEGTDVAPALNDREKLAKFDDEWYRQTIAAGRPAQGMPTWGKVLSPAQIKDLVAYLRSWETTPEPEPTPEPGGDPVAGAAIFQATCVTCHGKEGAGTDRAPTLNDPEVIAAKDDAFYRDVITEGRLEQDMPRWGQVLSPAEINDLVALIRSWESGEGPAAAAPEPTPAPDQALAGARFTFLVECAPCHGQQGQGDDGPALRPNDFVQGHTDEELKSLILDGRAGTEMEGFRGKLTDQDIADLIRLLRSWQE